jgi:NADPH:quinone reductase-like Zn-dependent oxidoreductase
MATQSESAEDIVHKLDEPKQEHIPPTMAALHLPPGRHDTASPPPPSSLIYDDSFPTPRPCPSDYLIKVLATSLCRGELTWPEVLDPARRGPPIPGHDICGLVLLAPAIDLNSSTGPKFRVDDEVFGLLSFSRDGGAADCTLAEEGELAFKPKNITAAEASTIPLSVLTAWQGLFQHGGLLPSPATPSQTTTGGSQKPIRVLITNASGGVGVQVLQLLRSHTLFGAQQVWVCGTCSHRNASFLTDELHADAVLDYTTTPNLGEAFTSRGWEPVDLVFDCIGGSTLRQAHSPAVVHDGGVVLSIAHPIPSEWDLDQEIQARGLKSTFFIVSPDGEQLGKVSMLVEKGELKGIVDRVFELYEGREAMELVESQRVRGKVVLRVNYPT